MPDIFNNFKTAEYIHFYAGRDKAEFDRSAWNWKPQEGNPTTELDDYQNLTAGIALDYKDSHEIYLNGNNLLGQEMEALDDVFTRFEGEAMLQVGIRYRW